MAISQTWGEKTVRVGEWSWTMEGEGGPSPGLLHTGIHRTQRRSHGWRQTREYLIHSEVPKGDGHGGVCLPVKGPCSPGRLRGWGKRAPGAQRLPPGRASPRNPRPTLCPLIPHPCLPSRVPASPGSTGFWHRRCMQDHSLLSASVSAS